MKPSRVLIKLGGASLQDDKVLETVTKALKQYRHYGYQVILVHGGGPAINAELTRRGIQWNFIKGQRVTSPEMMEVIETVLCGDINRKLVRHLGSQGVPAIGFSGADANTLLCEKASLQLGQVGAIKQVTASWIEGLLSLPNSPLPVISPIGIGDSGEAYNINADWAATHLAIALKAEYLVFLTDQKGILDANQEHIRQISQTELKGLLRRNVVTGGMYTKTTAVLEALKGGVKAVRVMNARDSVNGLWSNYVGTWCLPRAKNLYQYVPLNNPEVVSHVAI